MVVLKYKAEVDLLSLSSLDDDELIGKMTSLCVKMGFFLFFR